MILQPVIASVPDTAKPITQGATGGKDANSGQGATGGLPASAETQSSPDLEGNANGKLQQDANGGSTASADEQDAIGPQGATGSSTASADRQPSSDTERIIKPRTPEQVALQREAAASALAHCAKLVGAPATGWEKNADGAPIPNQGFYWSISHKPQWAAAVIADSPVGIDIEHIAPRRDKLIFDELADEEEWSLMPDRSWESFFMLWTAKEAVLKANGEGIGRFADCRLQSCSVPITPDSVVHQSPERQRVGLNATDTKDLAQSDWCPASMHLTFMGNPWQVSHYLHKQHIVAVTCYEIGVQWQPE